MDYTLLFDVAGRLCNQLYYTLQAYIRTDSANHYRYNPKIQFLFNQLQNIGVGEYITTSFQNPITDGIKDHYYQDFSRDYTLSQIEEFVSNTILKYRSATDKINGFSSIYNSSDRETLAVYIRNGDYLLPQQKQSFSWFDRERYITESLERNKDVKEIYVCSDDLSECEKYRPLFNKYAEKVEFLPKQSVEDDFLRLCSFRRKIIFNSTFGYWSSFVSNVIYKNSYSEITAPSKLIHGEEDQKVNDKWEIIQV